MVGLSRGGKVFAVPLCYCVTVPACVWLKFDFESVDLILVFVVDKIGYTKLCNSFLLAFA